MQMLAPSSSAFVEGPVVTVESKVPPLHKGGAAAELISSSDRASALQVLRVGV